MRAPFRKPLVVVAPKKLLRFKGACSSIEDFAEGTKFLPVIGDKNSKALKAAQIKKVIFCSGQVYYDLEATRAKENRNDVAILRVESFCPFPFGEIMSELKQYTNATVTWAQEEPKNAGGWTHVEPRMRNIQTKLGRKAELAYAGRPMMAAAATGYGSSHRETLEQLLKDAFK